MTAYFTTTTAAAELGVTPGRVRAMITAGRLHATLAGRDWLIARQSLDAVRDRKPGRPPVTPRKAQRWDSLLACQQPNLDPSESQTLSPLSSRARRPFEISSIIY